MTPQDFIAAIAPAAVASMKKTRVPASFTTAEAALESGWGNHAPGMNLFGVKADRSWTGPFTTQRTREVIHGKGEIVEAKFRAYSDWQGCIDDHAKFLTTNPRYMGAFKLIETAGADCGEVFARAVAKAGYATDPQYADKIIAVMHSHDLAQFDQVA